MTPYGKNLASEVAKIITTFERDKTSTIVAELGDLRHEFKTVKVKFYAIPAKPRVAKPVKPVGFRIVAQHQDENLRLLEAVAVHQLLKEAGINCKICPSRSSSYGIHHSVLIYSKSTITMRTKILPDTQMAKLAAILMELPELAPLEVDYEVVVIDGVDLEQVRITKFPKTIEAREFWRQIIKRVEKLAKERKLEISFVERQHPLIINKWTRFPKPIVGRLGTALNPEENEVHVTPQKDFEAELRKLQENKRRAGQKPKKKKMQAKKPAASKQTLKEQPAPANRFVKMIFPILTILLGKKRAWYLVGFDPEDTPSDEDLRIMKKLYPGASFETLEEAEERLTN